MKGRIERGAASEPAVHPEASIDRAIAGKISDSERETLERHLEVCVACAAHVAVARSGQAALQPLPWDSGLNNQAIERVLARVERGRWEPMRFWFRRRWAMSLIAVLLGLGGAASATWWKGRRVDAPAWFASETAPVAARLAATHKPAVVAVNSLVSSPAAESAPDRFSFAQRAPRSTATAAALFEEASVLRDRNQPQQAIVVFRRLQRRYPEARETRISFALAGKLLLEQGRPAQALAQFDRHLARAGEAAEEALAGRATALKRMGRVAEEEHTWRNLLQAYPRSVYANQARARLVEIQAAQESRAPFEGAPAADGIGHERSTSQH